MLLRYCIGQECGGVITDCAGWKDRKWQQLAKVTLAEVRRESDLWQWVGDNLVVRFYPSDKETQVRQKRETARTNGKGGGRQKTNPEETDVGFPEEPTLASSEKAEGEGEGERKEKGIGKEGEAKSAATPLARSRLALDRSEIIGKINSIKPEWQKPSSWSAMEMHDLHSTLAQVVEMDDSDWDLLRRYMAARTQTGAGFWQPKSRGQFVANFSDVYGHAQRWASKDKPRTVRQPEQVQVRDKIDRDSLKSIFG